MESGAKYVGPALYSISFHLTRSNAASQIRRRSLCSVQCMGIQRAQCLQDNVKQAGLGGVKKMIEVTINVPSTMSAERLFPLQSHQPRRTISNCVVGAKIQTQKSSERVRF